MTDLAQACDELAAALTGITEVVTTRDRADAGLAQAGNLLTDPDADGSSGGGKPGSRPPWNPATANAALDAHEGLRRLEAAMRLSVAGHPGPKRGGSDANTMAAIKAIEALGHGADQLDAAEAERRIRGWVNAIEQLPAIDEAERPQRVIANCPYCGFGMLRVFPRSGRVACLRMGACQDSEGKTPTGRLEISRLDGTPCISWNDGLVT